MWPYKPKTPPKPEIEKPKYEVGDKVRVWKVLKNPTGRVQNVFEEKGVTKFTVYYEYHDGRMFTESFEGCDLTLVEKYSKASCNCGSNSSRHSDWCNKVLHPNGW